MNRNLLFLLCFVINLSVFSQNYQVIYKIEPNQNNVKSIKDPMVKHKVEDKLKEQKNHKFQLLIAGNKAEYSFYEQMLPEGMSPPKIGNVYYDGMQVLEDKGDVFVKYDLKHHQWTITNETMEINGYICYRAFAKQLPLIEVFGKMEEQLEAWFCPDFPTNYGPKNFFGLPGLVLAAGEKGNVNRLVAEKIISLTSAPKLKQPKIDKTLTPKEYKELVNQNVNEFLKDFK